MSRPIKVFSLKELEPPYCEKDPAYPGCLIWKASSIGPYGQPIVLRNGRYTTVIQHYMALVGITDRPRVKRLCNTHGCVAPEHHWWEGKRKKRGKE